MGMFDWVDYECDCPKCGAKVTGFQTKCDPTNAGLYLNLIPFGEVDNFYSSCDQCRTWIEYTITKRRPPLKITDYTMTIDHKLDKQNDTT